MRVIFPKQKKPNSNEILYPDDIELFGNTEDKEDNIIADYRGDLALTEYIPDPDPVRISNIDLWDRFTEAEQEDLLDSAKKKSKKFLYDLKLKTNFDLTNQKLINTINALETAGIIGAGRADEILTI